MPKYYKIEEQELLSLLSDSRELAGYKLQAQTIGAVMIHVTIVVLSLKDYPETVAEDLPSLYEVIN